MRKNFLQLIAIILCVCAMSCAGQETSWRNSVANTASIAPDAEIVVVDIASGRVLAARKLEEAARTLVTPGSTLKPVALYQLITQRRWNPQVRITCSRSLHVAGHALNCPHPPMPAMDAETALTWSCNTYFAAVAGSMAPEELRGLLAPSGLLGATGLAKNEAVARMQQARTPADIQLEFLGVDGIAITPLELVHAYRWLAMEFMAHPESSATQVVLGGLKDSASFGMAGAAALGGVAVAGKTGTASATDSVRTHGWFVGVAPADAPRVALVVYQPVGRGADAAHIAAGVLARSPLGKR